MRSFRMIVAYSFPKMGIGKSNKMAWNIPEDLQNFKRKTLAGGRLGTGIPVVIMGRKTWESLPSKTLPKLKDRINVVITNNTSLHTHFYHDREETVFCSFENLNNTLDIMQHNEQIAHNPYIIGGSDIYKLALEHLDVESVDVTEVYNSPVECDVFFPVDLMKSTKFHIEDISCFIKSNDLFYRYIKYVKTPKQQPFDYWSSVDIPKNYNEWLNKEEEAYLTVMNNITKSAPRLDRTGVGTFSLFGQQLTYNLSDTFPLSTTKKMFMRGIFEELMMYLRGQTDNKILNEKGVHVWDGNTSREFLDKRGLDKYEPGDMGSTYGFNFRHFGAKYTGCRGDYTGLGHDQLQDVIQLLKHDPDSRRIIINLWDPAANHNAALPSCLCMYQFYTRKCEESQYLDLQIYIRSNDYFLANNWNTCTGALLVHLLCSVNGLTHFKPGKLIVCIGDAHIYSSHLEQVRENVSRTPYPFPKLVVMNSKDKIEDFEFSDIQLLGYRSHPAIKAPMAV
jgi:dihydrofolate reductase/thymidylate synthase